MAAILKRDGLSLCSVAHLAAFEQGDVGDDEDERENASKVGSKDWLKAKKRHVIKKSQEEGFQDKLIRGIASLIAVIIMLVLLYGAIGLLSGDGVEQYPCETIRELSRVHVLGVHSNESSYATRLPCCI